MCGAAVSVRCRSKVYVRRRVIRLVGLIGAFANTKGCIIGSSLVNANLPRSPDARDFI